MWFVRAEGLNKLGKPVKPSYTARFEILTQETVFQKVGEERRGEREKKGWTEVQ